MFLYYILSFMYLRIRHKIHTTFSERKKNNKPPYLIIKFTLVLMKGPGPFIIKLILRNVNARARVGFSDWN